MKEKEKKKKLSSPQGYLWTCISASDLLKWIVGISQVVSLFFLIFNISFCDAHKSIKKSDGELHNMLKVLKRVTAIWPPWRYGSVGRRRRRRRRARLAEASEGGRICFMRVIDALLQEKRAKQAWNCAGDQIRIGAYGRAEGEQRSLAARGGWIRVPLSTEVQLRANFIL